jgi:hypothetical protein
VLGASLAEKTVLPQGPSCLVLTTDSTHEPALQCVTQHAAICLDVLLIALIMSPWGLCHPCISLTQLHLRRLAQHLRCTRRSSKQ